MCFAIGALASWPASNNAAMFAEASIMLSHHNAKQRGRTLCTQGNAFSVFSPVKGTLACSILPHQQPCPIMGFEPERSSGGVA